MANISMRFLKPTTNNLCGYLVKMQQNRLRLMFAKAKFDAVIEYSATFISESEIDVNKLSFHKLDEGGHVVFGYIACANSELGNAVIKMYNELLRQPSNQKMIAESHYVEFFGQEAYFVQEAITQKLKEP